MNTYAYFDEAGTPRYTASYSNDADVPETPAGYRRVALTADFSTLLQEYWLSPSGDLVNRGAAPSKHHEWDAASLLWVVTPAALDQAKSDLKLKVDTLRDVARAAGVTYNGVDYDSDPVSSANITEWAAVVTAGVVLPEGFTWRSKDNQDIPFSASDILGLAAAIAVSATTCYRRAWAVKARIDALLDYSQLVDFDIETEMA